jgi:hypothetical protein
VVDGMRLDAERLAQRREQVLLVHLGVLVRELTARVSGRDWPFLLEVDYPM